MREQRVDEHHPANGPEARGETGQVWTRATVPRQDNRRREVDVVDAVDRDTRAAGAQLVGHEGPGERACERARDEHERRIGHG
jgi:hypothetical protein